MPLAPDHLYTILTIPRRKTFASHTAGAAACCSTLGVVVSTPSSLASVSLARELTPIRSIARRLAYAWLTCVLFYNTR